MVGLTKKGLVYKCSDCGFRGRGGRALSNHRNRFRVNLKEARRLHEKGVSWERVAKNLGISTRTLFNRRKNKGCGVV